MKKITVVCFILLLVANAGWAQDFELVPYRLKNEWGFADSLGNVKIKPKYEDVIPFNEGYAAYKKKGKWGFINKKGKELITPKYDSIYRYIILITTYDTVSEKTSEVPHAEVYIKGEKVVVDLKGNEKKHVDYIAISKEPWDGNEWVSFSNKPPIKIINENNLYGFINNKKQQRYEPIYDSLIYTHHPLEGNDSDFLLARKNGLWGIVDCNNQTLVDFQYEDMRSQYRNVLYPLVKKNGLWGIIDTRNQVMLNLEYDHIKLIISDNCSLSYYILKKDNKYAAFSKKYKNMLPLDFYTAITPDPKTEYCDCGLYFTIDNGNVGYYNVEKGKIYIEPQYKWIDYNDSSKFLLFKDNDLYGYQFIGTAIKVDAKYKSIVPFKEGKNYTMVITTANKKGYINRKGLEFFKD